jgi:hypothetical protein
MDYQPTRDGHWPGESGRVARFDKIEIVLPQTPEELRALLPLADLQAHALTSTLQHYSLYDYRAKLLIVAPDRQYWEILARYEAQLGEYKICYVELAYDTFFQSALDAKRAAQAEVQVLRKKHHRRGEIKVVGDTVYFEDRKARTNLKEYPRADKRTGEPLVRVEWILKHAAHIRKKTDIATISDLRDFDFEPFFTKHYLREEIDYERLARWFNNIPVRAKVVEHSGGFLHTYAQLGYRFCLGHEIESAAQLRQHFKEERENIRARGGPRTPGEQKYARLSYYKLNSFFRPLAPEGGEPL